MDKFEKDEAAKDLVAQTTHYNLAYMYVEVQEELNKLFDGLKGVQELDKSVDN